jgi:uncharacterized RDD family membrane protein YckC
MDSSQIAPGPSVSPRFASLGRRIGAYILDVLIAFSVLVLVAITFRVLRAAGLWMPVGAGALPPGAGATPEELWRALGVGAKLAIMLAFVISGGTIYLILFECSPWQATFGKRLLNIYVTDNDGRRISLPRSFGRWLAMWVFSLFGGSLISLITIVATKNKKALHDLVANTLVVSGKPVGGQELESWRVVLAFALPFVWILVTFMTTII